MSDVEKLQRQTLIAIGIVLELLSAAALIAFGTHQAGSIGGYMLLTAVVLWMAVVGRLRLAATLTTWLLFASLIVSGQPWDASGRQAIVETAYSAFFLLPLLLSSFLQSTLQLFVLSAATEAFFLAIVLYRANSTEATIWDTNILFLIPLFTVVAWRAAVIYRVGIRSVETAARAEARLVQVSNEQGMAEAGREIAEGITHDIVAPLGPIAGTLELVQSDLTNNDIQDAKEGIAAVLDRVKSLASDGRNLVLEMRGVFSSTTVSLPGIIDRVVRRLPLSMIEISCQLDASATHVDVPWSIMMRAIQNALENALAFAKTTVHITSYSDNGLVSIVIDDDGPGINTDILKQGIKPGLSRRDGGSGTGLAGVQASLKAYNGQVWLENVMQRASIAGGRTIIRVPLREKDAK